VPWPYILVSIAALAILILLVLMQRAQLVKYQYDLVDSRMERAKVLKQRDELKLTIQRLSALERIDAISHKHLQMARPLRRRVLDLSQYHVTPVPATASLSTSGGTSFSSPIDAPSSRVESTRLTSTLPTKDEEEETP